MSVKIQLWQREEIPFAGFFYLEYKKIVLGMLTVIIQSSVEKKS